MDSALSHSTFLTKIEDIIEKQNKKFQESRIRLPIPVAFLLLKNN